jgi:hypothetical protein
MMSLTEFGLVALGAEETDMEPPDVAESNKGERIIVQAAHGCQTGIKSRWDGVKRGVHAGIRAAKWKCVKMKGPAQTGRSFGRRQQALHALKIVLKVEVEDVHNLPRLAVDQHQISSDYDVHTIRGRRRQHAH